MPLRCPGTIGVPSRVCRARVGCGIDSPAYWGRRRSTSRWCRRVLWCWAPVVSGCISAGGFADADRFCRTTPLGTLGARWAGVGRGGGRRRLASRPCALLGLAELSALLGNPLSTRNSLAERVIGESPAGTACRLLGCRAGAAHLAGSLPGQHDRRSRPSRAEQ